MNALRGTIVGAAMAGKFDRLPTKMAQLVWEAWRVALSSSQGVLFSTKSSARAELAGRD